jgi:GDP-4-dehydro-6-deoxy-D-mannose reductase
LKVLVTGAGGFVGRHLLANLHTNPDMALHGTLIGEFERQPALVELCPALYVLDLRDPVAVRDLLATIQPDQIYHLAGQAYVPRSFEDPWDTIETNIRGTLNLLESLHELKLSCRILIVGSAEVYGSVQPGQLPLNENTPFAPSSPYSVSKVAQDMLALQYTLAYKIFTVRVRPFNHIGPGQNERFSVSDWAKQIVGAELGQREAVLYVGNLTAARDFTDVRDVVRAYTSLLIHGLPGEVYNVCSGKAHSMQTIMETLISFSNVPIEVRVEADRFRPVEIPIMTGDSSRLRSTTGWQPEISLEQSLHDVLDEWRQRINAQITKPL